MWNRNRQNTQGLEQTDIPGFSKSEGATGERIADILAELGVTGSDLGSIAADLEVSDAFQQRLGAINREIERQFKARKTQEGV